MTPTIDPSRTNPAVTAPMLYNTNMTLLASLIPLNASPIAEGHWRSVSLIPDLSSFWIDVAGSKWNFQLVLEHAVTSFDGVK